MEIITKGRSMRDKVAIQVEDWSGDYPNLHAEADTLAAYPVVVSLAGLPQCMQRAYRPGVDRMRITYQFPDAESCETAFLHLSVGAKKLADYKRYAERDSAQRLGNVELD